jgi:ribosome-associated protein
MLHSHRWRRRFRCPHQGGNTLAYAELAAGTRAAPEAATVAATGPRGGATDPAALLALILASLEDDKAEEIVTIDLRGRSSMADAMVIASGRSTRQVTAIAQKLLDRLKQRLGYTARTEGMEAGDWVLIDAGDVVVHVFRPEVRQFYQLEKMWQPTGDAAPRA